MSRALTAYIDTAALQANLGRIKAIAPKQSVLAMVKADGYGHGIITAVQALGKADAFGVACLSEARMLRQTGVKKPIVLMEGFFTEDEIPEMIKYQCDVVIHHVAHIRILLKRKEALTVWIKVNTGMNRLGLSVQTFLEHVHTIQANKNITIKGVMTHFSHADELDNPKTQHQIQLFEKAINQLSYPVSLANSAGILGWPASHGDWIRPGLALYGASPFPDKLGQAFGLIPAMTLASQLISIQQVSKGEHVGYSGQYRCPENMPVGIVAIGYGDGYPKNAPNGTPVIVSGIKTRVIGRVSMDMLAVDLRPVKDAKVEDKVILWGPDLPVETVAKAIGIIPHELLTRLSNRVPRRVQ